MKPADETITKMLEAADRMNEQNDNLLKAIAILAEAGQITIIPNDIGWSKPVLHLPIKMYDRLRELTARGAAHD